MNFLSKERGWSTYTNIANMQVKTSQLQPLTCHRTSFIPKIDHSVKSPEQSHTNRSPIASRLNHGSVYPPIIDNFEWMKIQTNLPLYVLHKLYC